jgi:hypothetical protein
MADGVRPVARATSTGRFPLPSMASVTRAAKVI